MISDPDVQLLTPDDDVLEPELSLVIPGLNEERTIGLFIDWCWEGIRAAGIAGEILIVDSGTDRTAAIALSKGARVLKTPRRGLGRAYIDALPYARGKYLILGDCDCTYDFRELSPFVEKMKQGFEFIMGSRFRGRIDPGAMPPLHRYLGTPVTTWILNRIFSSRFSDIHCGMRGITKEAFTRMRMNSQSWEYASEMVLKSVRMQLRTTEVPIHFLKDQEGRLSHHRRSGWLSPWKAAWINLREMFVYGADFFLLKPGIAIFALGVMLVVPLSFGPFSVGSIQFSLYWMLFGMSLTILGLQSIYLGLLARVFFDYSGAVTRRVLEWFPYNRTTLLSALTFGIGLALMTGFALYYWSNHFLLPSIPMPWGYLAVTGLCLMILAFMTFCYVLLLHGFQHTKHIGPLMEAK
jgi:glycosyltransferase involved in cell wall biosynthesis